MTAATARNNPDFALLRRILTYNYLLLNIDAQQVRMSSLHTG